MIDLGYARVQGYLNSTDSQYWWKGIRYASADRFQAPRTPATHTAVVYNASAYGPICFQASEGAVTLQGKPPVANFTIANQSEDCLYLNINAPAGACEGSNLPVLVWIHGGGEFLPDFTSDARSPLTRRCPFSPQAMRPARRLRVATLPSLSPMPGETLSSSRSSTASDRSGSSPGKKPPTLVRSTPACWTRYVRIGGRPQEPRILFC